MTLVAEERPGSESPPPGRRARPGLQHRLSWFVALTVALSAVPKGKPATGVRLATVLPADVGAVLLVAATTWVLLRHRDQLGRLRDLVLLGPLAVVVAALLSALWSSNPTLSLVAVSRYVEIFLVVPVAVALAVRRARDVTIVLGSFVVLGVGEGALGVYQAITHTGGGFEGQTVRAVGTYGVDDVLGMATVVACAQIVLIAVALRGPRPWTRVAGLAGAAALTIPLVLSLSRGALLALVVAAAAMLLSTGLRTAIGCAVVVACLAVVGVASSGGLADGTVASRFTSIGSSAAQPDRSVQDRYELWATALSIWQLSPVTGVGIKEFPTYRDSNAPLSLSSGSELATATTYTRGELLSPHNEYLLLLSEQGVVGLGAFLALGLLLGQRMLALWRGQHRRPARSNGSTDVLGLASLGFFTWYAVDLLYGDIAGPGAVQFALLLGVQLRFALTRGEPVARGR